MASSKLSGKPDEILGDYLRWTSIPSRRSSNTPSRFMLQKTGTGSYASQARGLIFFCFLFLFVCLFFITLFKRVIFLL